jgi:threonine dehydratase/serine racemase
MYAASLADIRAAQHRIRPYAHRTPILTSRTLDDLSGRQLFFKCELFQRVGAFKFRGALNAVLQLDDTRAARGVVTHSSGNHAQALALAARIRNIPAHVVIPGGAPRVKRLAVEGYGAIIYTCEPSQRAREQVAERVAAETGATLIPSYDHPDIIAGQGTIGLELLAEIADLDAIITPVGGGGLLSGVTLAAKALKSDIRIFAGEPEEADDAARSKRAGRLIPQPGTQTVADGLRTSLGQLTWPVLRDQVEGVYTVSEEAIVAAMRLVWERQKILVEPSAAVPVAAVLGDSFKRLEGIQKVGVVLSGGNVDLDHLPWR